MAEEIKIIDFVIYADIGFNFNNLESNKIANYSYDKNTHNINFEKLELHDVLDTSANDDILKLTDQDGVENELITSNDYSQLSNDTQKIQEGYEIIVWENNITTLYIDDYQI